jgi:hypothetical protein
MTTKQEPPDQPTSKEPSLPKVPNKAQPRVPNKVPNPVMPYKTQTTLYSTTQGAPSDIILPCSIPTKQTTITNRVMIPKDMDREPSGASSSSSTQDQFANPTADKNIETLKTLYSDAAVKCKPSENNFKSLADHQELRSQTPKETQKKPNLQLKTFHLIKNLSLTYLNRLIIQRKKRGLEHQTNFYLLEQRKCGNFLLLVMLVT